MNLRETLVYVYVCKNDNYLCRWCLSLWGLLLRLLDRTWDEQSITDAVVSWNESLVRDFVTLLIKIPYIIVFGCSHRHENLITAGDHYSFASCFRRARWFVLLEQFNKWMCQLWQHVFAKILRYTHLVSKLSSGLTIFRKHLPYQQEPKLSPELLNIINFNLLARLHIWYCLLWLPIHFVITMYF